MQLHQIEAVVAITAVGSFRKAAEVLGRTQPTLTKSIKALEEPVNLVVFGRTPRGVQLTEGGERLYKRTCTVMADDLNAAKLSTRTRPRLCGVDKHAANWLRQSYDGFVVVLNRGIFATPSRYL